MIRTDPVRGGKHPIHGIYLGGSSLQDDYSLKRLNSYKYTTQLRSSKQSASSERALMDSRDSSSIIKFDGKLELSTSATIPTELDKDEFIKSLKDKVSYYGLQTFFYLPGSNGTMLSLLDHAHSFSLQDVIAEFQDRCRTPKIKFEADLFTVTQLSKASALKAYDEYEQYDFALSRLVVESIVTTSFRRKVETRFSHEEDFDDLPGQVYFMMILEACNASASLDIDGATKKIRELSLSSFPGENVSDLATTALKLINIMDGAYAMPVNIGSTLIRKVSNSSCQYFNRTMFGHLDKARQMEIMYKIKNPMLLKADPLYSRYGPIGICGLLQDEYSKLFAEHE